MVINRLTLILISLLFSTVQDGTSSHHHHRHHHRNHKHHLNQLTNPILERICKQTDHPELCVSSISPLVTSGAPLDVISVLKLEINAGMDATKAAQATLDAMLAKRRGTTGVAAALGDCKEVYDDALDNYSAAAKAISERDVGTINSMLSAVITDYATCNDSFGEVGKTSPMADVSRNLTMLCSNCLAIVSLIK